MIRWFTLLLCVACSARPCWADQPTEIDRLDRVVCIETRDPAQPKNVNLSSAFIVRGDKRLFLVTAGHSAEDTTVESRILYRDLQGASQWVKLKVFIVPSANPWYRDPKSDFAITELRSSEENNVYFSSFQGLAFPLTSLSLDAPKRTTPIVTPGFPIGLGIQDQVSPIAVTGHIASRVTLAESKWGKEPVMFSTPALAQGTSGGPTLLLSEPEGSLTVVGMPIGVVYDSTGAKLSKMVPAAVIRERIIEMLSANEEN